MTTACNAIQPLVSDNPWTTFTPKLRMISQREREGGRACCRWQKILINTNIGEDLCFFKDVYLRACIFAGVMRKWRYIVFQVSRSWVPLLSTTTKRHPSDIKEMEQVKKTKKIGPEYWKYPNYFQCRAFQPVLRYKKLPVHINIMTVCLLPYFLGYPCYLFLIVA